MSLWNQTKEKEVKKIMSISAYKKNVTLLLSVMNSVIPGVEKYITLQKQMNYTMSYIHTAKHGCVLIVKKYKK